MVGTNLGGVVFSIVLAYGLADLIEDGGGDGRVLVDQTFLLEQSRN